jgi:hypothetical protein
MKYDWKKQFFITLEILAATSETFLLQFKIVPNLVFLTYICRFEKIKTLTTTPATAH